MKIKVITSFNKDYYDRIGKDSVSSWLKHWPTELSLTCFVEEFEIEKNQRIEQVSFEKFSHEYFEFQKTETGRNVRKFAKKAFSLLHALENFDVDRVIWLDADVITVKNLPIKLLKSLLPDNVLSTQMGVTYTDCKDGRTGNWYVPETGFFAINRRHTLFLDFFNMYKKMYVNKEWKELRRKYDNDVFGYALKTLNAPTMDLCEHFVKGYKTPLKHTVLGDYLHHYKAKHSKEEFESKI